MSNHKIIKLPPRSPIGSDDECEINVTLEQETETKTLKEPVIEHNKINFNPIILNNAKEQEAEEAEQAAEEEQEQEQEAEEAEQEAEEAEEAAEAEEAKAAEKAEKEYEYELDDNIKDFIVLCTHRYLYRQEVPSLSSNKRRQKGMENIVARHVDSICEAFKYLS